MASLAIESELQHNIRVHAWPKRDKENIFGHPFKFPDFEEAKNLNNWIGRSMNTVNTQTTVTFTYPINYTDTNFMLISREIMDNLIREVFKVYRGVYSNDETWLNAINPYIMEEDKLFPQDPVFAQRVLIENPDSRIFFIGDVHSSLHSLIEILYDLNKNGAFKSGSSFELNSNCYIFFLGDLVDRGPYSVEVISLAFLLKLANHQNVFIVNGNHEDRPLYGRNDASTGFGIEIENQLGEYEKLHQLMYALPSVIYLEFAGRKYHLSHGAIPLEESQITSIGNFLKSKSEFFLIEAENYLHPLKWGDLKVDDGINISSDRPEFGSDNIARYTTLLDIECLITGHQDFEALMILPTKELSFEEVDTSANVSLDIDEYIDQFSVFSLEEELDNFNYKSDEELQSISSEPVKKLEISFNNNTFRHCRNRGINCATFYNHSREPLKYDLFKRYGDIESFDFDPINILALTTSTATISKNIPSNTYLELVAKTANNLRVYRESINDLNETRSLQSLPNLLAPIPLRRTQGIDLSGLKSSSSLSRNSSFNDLSEAT